MIHIIELYTTEELTDEELLKIHNILLTHPKVKSSIGRRRYE